MRDPQQPLSKNEDVPEREASQEQLKETGRIEAFSDGIFAVAITLLVLNIQVPKTPTGELWGDNHSLGMALLGQGQWTAYLAFVTSFATIGIMWINHHRLFNYIKSSNDSLLTLNLLLLMLIVFVPFPTALLADYLQPQYTLAAAIYSATFVLLAICFNVLWRYASHNNRLLDKKVDQRAVQAITQQYRFGPFLYLVAFALAFIYAPASIIWNLLLAVFFALPSRSLKR
jgi:TMEM175 potassium channel family protein